MELLQLVGLVIRGAAVRSPMILGPIGQKWVCAAGVERSTLHRCGLTGQRALYVLFPFSIGMRELAVIHK